METHYIERTPEYEEFMARLRDFHDQRGTNFDPEPKLGVNHVDLYKLFTYIVDHGGYDAVSDEKLAWRKMCEGLGLMTSNPPAAAFSLKSIFYKNLAAFEIKTIHNKEPPPPEILELVSAKGSGLLNRTIENYTGNRRETMNDRSEDDGTPMRRMDDTPGSGRASRGLREAPQQRVIFQPDTNSSRQPRHPSSHHSTPVAHGSHHASPHVQAHSHSHGHIPHPHMQSAQHLPQRGGPSHIYNPPTVEQQVVSVQNYQPGDPVWMQTRVVQTPGNTPEAFAQGRRFAYLQATGSKLLSPQAPRLPGSKSYSFITRRFSNTNHVV
jgi:chromatin structure-remodeling complex subunit RSC9